MQWMQWATESVSPISPLTHPVFSEQTWSLTPSRCVCLMCFTCTCQMTQMRPAVERNGLIFPSVSTVQSVRVLYYNPDISDGKEKPPVSVSTTVSPVLSSYLHYLCFLTSLFHSPSLSLSFFHSSSPLPFPSLSLLSPPCPSVLHQCVNTHTSAGPDPFEYITHRTHEPDVHIPTNPEFLVCCSCTDNCANRSRCECWQLTFQESSVVGGERKYSVGYVHQRLNRQQHSAYVKVHTDVVGSLCLHICLSVCLYTYIFVALCPQVRWLPFVCVILYKLCVGSLYR